MGFKIFLTEVEQVGERIWTAALTPAEIARLGTPAASVSGRSVIGVTRPGFDEDEQVLSFDPGSARVLNAGSEPRAILIELGEALQPALGAEPSVAYRDTELRRGDEAFLEECKRHLPKKLAEGAVQLIAEMRRKYAGQLHEGPGRKWVNHPGNFVALIIQPRDRSLAIHVKGRPEDFSSPSLDIRSDHGGYCWFKLRDIAQLQDAGRVVQVAARNSEGY